MGVAAVRGDRAGRCNLRARVPRTRSRTSSCTWRAIRAWEGKPPVGVKIVIEGQEEVGGGAFATFPTVRPELFAADAMVIGDMGSVRPGVPTLTIALRGMLMAVTVEARTLAGPKHSGQFGGAAPDALLTLHPRPADDARRERRRRRGRPPARAVDGCLVHGRGVPVAVRDAPRACRSWGRAASASGSGRGRRSPSPVSTRSRSRPAVNAVVPFARAKVSGRIHPEQDPLEAQAALVRVTSRGFRPYGVALVAPRRRRPASGFAADTGGPGVRRRS